MSDAYNGLVTLLLRMEGVNGSPYFRDDSNFPKIVTVNGNAAISTAQSKWGNGSGYFGGTEDYLLVSGVGLSNTPFTIEFYVYFTAVDVAQVIASQYITSPVGRWGFDINNTGIPRFFLNGLTEGNLTIAHGSSVSAGAWHHFAATRDTSNNINFWVNGSGNTPSNRTGLMPTDTVDVCIGGLNSGYPPASPLTGYMQDIRITKGVARYTANFTPPSRLENPANPLNLSLTTQYYDASGWYRIKGSVVELGVAGSYRVRLFERQTGRLIREMWSASDGAYTFNYIPYIANGYYVIAFDHGNNPLNAAIADLVTPELMP